MRSHLPVLPFHCSAPGCTFRTASKVGNIVQHWNNSHSEDPSKAIFTEQATGATLDLFATCKFIMQCTVCMKVRTSSSEEKMNQLIFKMRSHIAAAHPEELEATNGCSEPLYRVLQDRTGRNEH